MQPDSAQFSASTRRWQRFPIDLPVRIAALNGTLIDPISARGTDISRAGMALRTGIPVRPGDSMQLQFPTSTPCKVMAVVRNRVGNRLGLEFLTQLPPDDEVLDSDVLSTMPATEVRQPACASISRNPDLLFKRLRQKQEELRHLRMEIEALKLAIPLLTDGEKDLRGANMTARCWGEKA